LFSVFLKFLSSILVRTIEKSVPLNLIKIILKLGVIWITCSRSLKLDSCYFLIGEINRGSLYEVREANFYLK